jgi:hypothetical protein
VIGPGLEEGKDRGNRVLEAKSLYKKSVTECKADPSGHAVWVRGRLLAGIVGSNI